MEKPKEYESFVGSRIPYTVLEAIRAEGGNPLLVGGVVRDMVLENLGRARFSGATPFFPPIDVLKLAKDLDFEVYNLSMDQLQSILEKFGEVDIVGKSFGVLKLHGVGHIDFSIPRRDNKVGSGHRGFNMEFDPSMTIEQAASRRDLTMNSMALDLFEMKIHDPFNGSEDLRNGVLRATDPKSFLEDPLRALRVAQFISRFDFNPDPVLNRLCMEADLSQLPGERLFEEFKKLLLGENPAKGLDFLFDTKLLSFFPEIQALSGCEQHPDHHPEGDVLTHTMMALNVARELTDDLVVLFAVLCHDFGKPSTTRFEDGKIRSKGHDEAGEAPTEAFLTKLCASNDFIKKVKMLVRHHLDPILFPLQGAGPRAYRRLARDLGSVGLTFETLFLVSQADRFGRTTPDALARDFSRGKEFMYQVEALELSCEAPKPYVDVVLGRHVLSRGFSPGPMIGSILKLCREAQDETGLTDPDEILNRVLPTLNK